MYRWYESVQLGHNSRPLLNMDIVLGKDVEGELEYVEKVVLIPREFLVFDESIECKDELQIHWKSKERSCLE